MFYITGDTHGDFSRYSQFAEDMQPTKEDTMIVLGDAGLNYHRNKTDKERKAFVSSFPFTTFCIYGNHEIRPADITSYKMREYHGGKCGMRKHTPTYCLPKMGKSITLMVIPAWL